MNESAIPLAERLRPKNLDEVIGQVHLVGSNGVIRKLLKTGFIPSMILWGPPGCGKTTLAYLLSTLTNSIFEPKSAVTTGLDDIRKVIKEAKERLEVSGQRTILFIDEIHRFNKAQQDSLLPHVERGTVIFIGATTENPSFEVISPLLSRCRVFVLNALTEKELNSIIDISLKEIKKTIQEDARFFLLQIANGDARQLITILEIAGTLQVGKKPLSIADIEEASQRKMLQYDTKGDEHYNTISAFIKSMRASDVDAALYYLARMVAAGEDPLFIARRMIVFASEDIGMAQPTALVVANDVFGACHQIGYPECQENLAHGVVYLALAKKDRRTYEAYMEALNDVKTYGNLPLPKNILNAPTKLMKDLGYGKGYDKYSTESHLPEKIKGKKYYKR
ncbi:MAG: Replication-associated recombination protein A [Candidatus Gottesmanbacteria bacterium GW2011_GWA2_44_17]|uniref:Replication-associated recombination protein A n=2 Tax=Candidatus Gottesmaniibacteriota TaxID=1752720 RepID=A0A0G1JV18_9BACT|nr:MAG: Replication-associated recombination protein A [Microgenomates group bacterium GW2011_GWC1_43_11]KKT38478.1 MAG: Replication-associated recombination protein A [Candidatus Gottesmanbacteria bacterium GW2011_GWB1_44_11c]KKT47792.1 MAG: Replication-associated recombination protein A [Candidatus Gottesmanbacteria bacterium GW2011_GWA2_44_17]HCM82785.1 AAA family ATPase [Patescibacteria group bacterium]